MKIYLNVDKQAISGYNSVDLSKTNLDFNNLNPLCEASECTEMILDHVLSYIELQQVPFVLEKLCTRLRKRGKIIIKGFDILDAIKTYLNGIASIADINAMLFGLGRIKKTSALSHTDITPLLNKFGLTVKSIDISNCEYIIIATRE